MRTLSVLKNFASRNDSSSRRWVSESVKVAWKVSRFSGRAGIEAPQPSPARRLRLPSETLSFALFASRSPPYGFHSRARLYVRDRLPRGRKFVKAVRGLHGFQLGREVGHPKPLILWMDLARKGDRGLILAPRLVFLFRLDQERPERVMGVDQPGGIRNDCAGLRHGGLELVLG